APPLPWRTWQRPCPPPCWHCPASYSRKSWPRRARARLTPRCIRPRARPPGSYGSFHSPRLFTFGEVALRVAAELRLGGAFNELALLVLARRSERRRGARDQAERS